MSESTPPKSKLNPWLAALGVAVAILLLLGVGVAFNAKDWWGQGAMQKDGQLGDYFNGMLGPFIALAGVVTTFAAFFIQFRANEEQKRALAEQGKQIKAQQEQQRIDRFEQRFWDMLRIHRENAAAFRIKAKPYQYFSQQEGVSWGNEQEFGPYEVINLINTEFDLVYKLHSLLFQETVTTDAWPIEVARLSYDLVFTGAISEIQSAKAKLPNQMEAFFNPNAKYEYDECLLDFVERRFSPRDSRKLLEEFENIYNSNPNAAHCPKILGGYSSLLSTYYRHAYQMFSELDSFTSPAFGDEEKKRFAKLFRAQLTDEEQRMFYYNSLGTAGKDWWEKGYITKYQLIKNVDLSQIPKVISPVHLLNQYLKNPGDAVLRDHLDRYLS
jgi:hypothetical protein